MRRLVLNLYLFSALLLTFGCDRASSAFIRFAPFTGYRTVALSSRSTVDAIRGDKLSLPEELRGKHFRVWHSDLGFYRSDVTEKTISTQDLRFGRNVILVDASNQPATIQNANSPIGLRVEQVGRRITAKWRKSAANQFFVAVSCAGRNIFNAWVYQPQLSLDILWANSCRISIADPAASLESLEFESFPRDRFEVELLSSAIKYRLLPKGFALDWTALRASVSRITIQYNGELFRKQWLYEPEMEIQNAEPGVYQVLVENPGLPASSITFDYKLPKVPYPLFPVNETSLDPIAFSFAPQAGVTDYSLQVLDAAGRLRFKGLVQNHHQLHLEPGLYTYQFVPLTHAETLEPSVWTKFRVLKPADGLQDFFGLSPTAPRSSLDAGFNYPSDVLPLGGGTYLVADTYNHSIKLVSNGSVERFAGTMHAGFTGDGARLNTALNQPVKLIADGNGGVIFADSGNYLIRRLDLKSGAIVTLFGLAGKRGAVDSAGRLLDQSLGWISALAMRGETLIVAMEFSDKHGNFLGSGIFEDRNGKLEPMIDMSKVHIGPVKGLEATSDTILLMTNKNLYSLGKLGLELLQSVDELSMSVRKIGNSIYFGNHSELFARRAGATRKVASGFAHVAEIRPDGEGNLLVVDTDGFTIYHVDPKTGFKSLVAGQSSSGHLVAPVDLARFSDHELLILDNQRPRILRVDVNTGRAEVVAGSGRLGRTVSGSDALETPMLYPTNLALNGAGDIFYSEQSQIFRIDHVTREVQLFAGSISAGYDDNCPRIEAKFSSVRGLNFDSGENLYVADMYNNAIRLISRSGFVTTVANSLDRILSTTTPIPIDHPNDVVPTKTGIVVVNSWANNLVSADATREVREIGKRNPGGYQGNGLSVDGSENSGGFNNPIDAYVERDGMFIADEFGSRIRYWDGRAISTVVGTGTQGYGPDSLSFPKAVVHIGDRLFIADAGNKLVRSLRVCEGQKCKERSAY